MDCFVLGDSIAVGTGAVLPECRTDARSGISSPVYAASHVVHADGEFALISLGSNDGSADTTAALETIRARITARRIVWLVPAVGARAQVLAVAQAHGDQVLDLRPLVGPDGIHPNAAGYQELARRARGGPP